MKSKYPLNGIVVSLNTPFNVSGKIDFESLGRSIEMHLREGSSGFLAPAQAGEVSALSLGERTEIVQFVQMYVGTRATFIAGATGPSVEESSIVAEAALKAGCDAVLVEIPQAYRFSRGATQKFCDSIARIGMPTLVIQDLDWNGFGLDVAWIVELFEAIDSFRCIKVEVRPAGPKYSAVIKATDGRLTVAGGWAADQMIEALDRGVDIIMPTAMTGMYSKVLRNHRVGNRQHAVNHFHKLLPVLAFTRQHLDISIQFYKRLFVRRGIFSTSVTRKKCLPYDDHHERYGEELMRYLEETEITAPNETISTIGSSGELWE
ncbi:MAG TPA: dihydrodipicolinate synthase family protein [Terriglobales bacterium]|nr:dihydrodipicolinate synthase family protein [Terriglobales bacterium]